MSEVPQNEGNPVVRIILMVVAVVYLIGKGVSPQRLVAAGFGEFQPIDLGKTDDAYKRNRRIEFKLTER